MRMALATFAALIMVSSAVSMYAAAPKPPAASVVTIDGVSASGADRPLYLYERDSEGKSACLGQCLAGWPALTPTADAQASGEWSIFTRSDGARQWAWKGKPVYVFFGDTPGKPATGDNKVSGWKLLK